MELIGGEKIWEFSWTVPGEINENFFHAKEISKHLDSEQLMRISDAKLYMYPYVPENILPVCKPIDILFNGEKVGELPRNSSTWYLSKHDKFLTIPPKLVKIKNKIVLTNPNKEIFAVRDSYLEVTLNNKEKVITPVYPYVCFSGNWKYLYMDFGLCHPTAGVMYSSIEINVPEKSIQSSESAQDLVFELGFKQQ